MTEFAGTNNADTITPLLVSPGVTTDGAAAPGLGVDQLYGGRGNDTLNGGGGADSSYGGQGDDYIFAVDGPDVAYGGTGIDTLDTTLFAFDYSINLATGATSNAGELFRGFENLVTGAGNDALSGNDLDNQIYAGGGNDTISFSHGNDSIYGGTGRDLIFAPDGLLTVDGGDGIDTLDASVYDGDYFVDLRTGQTTFEAESILGIEVLITGDGNDSLIADFHTSSIDGGAGNDTIDGRRAIPLDFTATGGAGDDVVIAFFYGSFQPEGRYFGGDGVDTLVLAAAFSEPNLNFSLGAQGGVFFTQQGFEILRSDYGNDTLSGAGLGGAVYGGDGNDRINGSEAGSDSLYGDAGNDTLTNSDFTQVMFGGAGDDSLTSFILIAVEAYGGDGHDSISGSNFTDQLYGGDGNDRIQAESGADIVYGGLGDDSLFGNQNGDQVYGDEGNDLLQFDSALALFGGAGDDTFSLRNLGGGLDGGDGFDTLIVRTAGDLNVELGTIGDLSIEGVIVGGGHDFVLGNDLDNRVEGRGGNDTLEGGDGADSLIGGSDDDELRGSSGDDWIYGGTGADVLIGGGGADSFVFDEVDGSVGVTADILRGSEGVGAFEAAGAAFGDLIDLSQIDANTFRAGNQAFRFGDRTIGFVRVANIDGNSVVQGNTDRDRAFEFILTIEDGGVLARAYTADDFAL